MLYGDAGDWTMMIEKDISAPQIRSFPSKWLGVQNKITFEHHHLGIWMLTLYIFTRDLSWTN